jgi:hypothetical protein
MFFIKKKKKPENDLPHLGDAKIWIENCIDSCQTNEQISTVFNLITLYEKQYFNQVDHDFLGGVTRELHLKRCNKWEEITKKELEK